MCGESEQEAVFSSKSKSTKGFLKSTKFELPTLPVAPPTSSRGANSMENTGSNQIMAMAYQPLLNQWSTSGMSSLGPWATGMAWASGAQPASTLSTPPTSTSGSTSAASASNHMQSPLGAQAAHAQAQASASFAPSHAPHPYAPMDLRRSILPPSGVTNTAANLSYLMNPYSVLQQTPGVANSSMNNGAVQSTSWLGMPVTDPSLWMQDRSRAVMTSPPSNGSAAGGAPGAKRASFSLEWAASRSQAAPGVPGAGTTAERDVNTIITPSIQTSTSTVNPSSSSASVCDTASVASSNSAASSASSVASAASSSSSSSVASSAGSATSNSTSSSATTLGGSASGESNHHPLSPSAHNLALASTIGASLPLSHDSEFLANLLPESAQQQIFQHSHSLQSHPHASAAHNLQSYPMHHFDVLRGMGMGGSLSGIPGLGAPPQLATGSAATAARDLSRRGKLPYNFRSFDARQLEHDDMFGAAAAFHLPAHAQSQGAAHAHAQAHAAPFHGYGTALNSHHATHPHSHPHSSAHHAAMGPSASSMPSSLLPSHILPSSHPLDSHHLLSDIPFLTANAAHAAPASGLSSADSLVSLPDSRPKRARSAQLPSSAHDDALDLYGVTSSGDPTERKFRCDVEGCQKTFKRSGHLKRHRLVHLPPNQRERYRCWKQTCNKHYSTKYDLAAHMRQAHGGVELLRCTFRQCARRFVRQESLDKHLKTFDHSKDSAVGTELIDAEDYDELATYLGSARTAGDEPYRHLLNAAEASSPHTMAPPPAKRAARASPDSS